jgi:hypothetical protein
MQEEIGSIEEILSSIKTKSDGSCLIAFEVNPDNIQTINKLMQRFLIDEKLFSISITQSNDNSAVSNG